MKKLNQSGFSLTELLVATSIGAIVMLASSNLFFDSVMDSHDIKIRLEAEEQARTILQMIINDIRYAGSGVPFYQTGFPITSYTLAQPITVSSSSTSQITIRRTIDDCTYNTTTATPTGAAFSINVDDVSSFNTAGAVSITNFNFGSPGGLVSRIASIGVSSVTTNAAYQYTPGQSFPRGSIVCYIAAVKYADVGTFQGITYTYDDQTAFNLYPKSDVTFAYMGDNQSVISLTNATLQDDLTAVRVTVQVRGSQTLKDGSEYTAWLRSQVTPRNLMLARNRFSEPK